MTDDATPAEQPDGRKVPAGDPTEAPVPACASQPEPEPEPATEPESEPESRPVSAARRPAEAPTARRRPEVSGPAVAATVALVLFSVFIGVFGPRLGNRQQLPAGTTLSELADAVSARHAQRVVQAVHVGAEPAFGRDEIARELEEVLGTAVAVPEVGAPGGPESGGTAFRWIGTDRVRLPGGSGVLAFLEAQRRGQRLFASVIVLRDEDRYTVFDAFGRPQPLPTGELFSVDMPGGTDSGDPNGLVQIYRDGDLVFAVQSTSPELAAELAARFRAAAAQAVRSARSTG